MMTGCSVWKISRISDEDLPPEPAELGATMVHHGAADRAQDAIGHVARAGDMQEVPSWHMLGLKIGHCSPSLPRLALPGRAPRSRGLPADSGWLIDHELTPDASPPQGYPEIAAMRDTHPSLGDPRLAGRLRRAIEGEVLFDPASRGRYATDASIYQVEPIGVIVPRSVDDVAAALAIARELGVPVLARGGGTSQCGQTVNRALVIDCSKHLRRDPPRRPRRAHGAGRAGPRAGPPQRRAAAARAVLSGRSLDPRALHAGRHGGQQFLRLQVDPLRPHGRQRRVR